MNVEMTSVRCATPQRGTIVDFAFSYATSM
jgi:hypothetical protein